MKSFRFIFGLIFIAIFIFRLLNSLIIRSYFDPDEYWQSLEIAHWKVFNIGYPTWEWKYEIRGSLFPWIFVILYSILEYFKLDNDNFWMWFSPKIIMSFTATWADLFTFLLARKLYGSSVGKWALFASLSSSFHMIYATRPLSNSVEMALTASALYFWPWTSSNFGKDLSFSLSTYKKALVLIGISCMIRVTSIIFWILPFTLFVLSNRIKNIFRIIFDSFIITGLVLVFSSILDFLFYQKWVFPPWNFFRFNILDNISEFYNANRWFWYLCPTLPYLLTGHMVVLLYGLWMRKSMTSPLQHHFLGFFLLSSLIIFSMVSHKEFRFIYPLLPALLVYVALSYQTFWSFFRHKTAKRFFIVAVTIFHILLSIFLNMFYSVGPLSSMYYLKSHLDSLPAKDLNSMKIFFLMPCHGTPYYSLIHYNISMDFLTCEPPLKNNSGHIRNRLFSKDPSGKSLSLTLDTERDIYYSNPKFYSQALLSKFTDIKIIVLYESLYDEIEPLLTKRKFKKMGTFFNAFNFSRSNCVGDIDCRGNLLILKKEPVFLMRN